MSPQKSLLRRIPVHRLFATKNLEHFQDKFFFQLNYPFYMYCPPGGRLQGYFTMNSHFNWLFTLLFDFVFAEPEPLTLILYLDRHMCTAVAALKYIPWYNKVLTLEQYEPPEGNQAEGAGTSGSGASVSTLRSTPITSAVGGSPPPKRALTTSPRKKGKKTVKTGKQLKPGEVDPADFLPPSRLAPLPMNVMQSALNETDGIMGKLPSDMPAGSPMFFGCTSTGQYLWLFEYLQINGEYRPVQVQSRGACQYASFRRGIDCPREFTNTHLHRQLVMELIKHKEFFLSILEERIAMNYGALRLSAKEYKEKCAAGTIMEEEKRVYHEPGPFSFRTYLEHILDQTSWGEEITLVLLGMLFQVWITLVDTTNLRSTQVCHNNRLDDVDIVLLFANGNHYMLAGKGIHSLGLSIGADHFFCCHHV